VVEVPDAAEERGADVAKADESNDEQNDAVIEKIEQSVIATLDSVDGAADPLDDTAGDFVAAAAPENAAPEAVAEDPAPVADEGAPALPEFLQRSMEDRLDAPPDIADDPVDEVEAARASLPVPDHVPHLTLTHLAKIKRLPPEIAQQIEPLAGRLRKLAS
jgi:hypothetical protein